VIRCTGFPSTYAINKDRVDIQSNIPPSSETGTPSSSDSSPQNDQPQSKVGVAAIIYGNRHIQSGREAWGLPDVSSFYVENHMKELFEIRSKSSKLIFGGYKESLLPPPAARVSKARGWITALSKELQMKYDNSLLICDQRSNRSRKKVERGASFSPLSAVSSPFLDEGGSILGKHLSGMLSCSFLVATVCAWIGSHHIAVHIMCVYQHLDL
jgi:hypothetical protein